MLDQVIIASTTATVVQITNLKAAILWVIAKILALTSPVLSMPPSVESGNSKTVYLFDLPLLGRRLAATQEPASHAQSRALRGAD
jgi:hypothetical protein